MYNIIMKMDTKGKVKRSTYTVTKDQLPQLFTMLYNKRYGDLIELSIKAAVVPVLDDQTSQDAQGKKDGK